MHNVVLKKGGKDVPVPYRPSDRITREKNGCIEKKIGSIRGVSVIVYIDPDFEMT